MNIKSSKRARNNFRARMFQRKTTNTSRIHSLPQLLISGRNSNKSNYTRSSRLGFRTPRSTIFSTALFSAFSLLVLSLTILTSSFMLHSASGIVSNAYATNTADLDLKASVSEVLALTLSTDDLALDLTPTSTGTFVSDSFTAITSTTNATGYVLYVKAIGEDHSSNVTSDLVHSSATVASTNTINTLSNPVTITPQDSSNFPVNKWGIAANRAASPSLGSTTFNPISTANSEISSNPTQVDKDTTNITIGAKVDTDILSGAYSNILEFTAIANPVPYTYTVLFDGNGGTFSPKVSTQTTSGWSCTPQDNNTKLSCTKTIYDERHPTIPYSEILSAYTVYNYGYAVGWSTTPGGTTSSTITLDYQNPSTNVYAVWSIGNYQLAINGDSHIASTTGSGSYAYEAVANLSATAETGYHVGYWTTTGGTLSTDTGDTTTLTMPGENVTVTVSSLPNNYNIVYNANGGTGSMDNGAATFATNTNLAENQYYRNGYSFVGWNIGTSGPDASTATYSDGATGVNASTLATNAGVAGTNNGTINLYAVWQPSYLYTLSYNANGGTNAPNNQSATGTTDVTFTIPSTIPERANYTFAGWAEDANTDPSNPSTTPGTSTYLYQPGNTYTVSTVSHIQTLYAIWAQDKSRVNIITDGYSSSVVSTSGQGTYNTGSTAQLSVTPATGYHVSSWSTDSGTITGSGNTATLTVPSGTANVTATIAPNTYTLNYNANGGTGPDPSSSPSGADGATITYGDSIALSANTYTRDNYGFIGWNIGTAGPDSETATYTDAQTSVSVAELVTSAGIAGTDGATLNLYAVWYPTISYSIGFDTGEGGSEPPAPQETESTSDAEFTIPTTAPTKEDYTFAGWSTDPNDDGSNPSTLVQPGNPYVIPEDSEEKDQTFYAIWVTDTKERVNVLGDANTKGTTGAGAYLPDSRVSISANVNSGYHFNNWTTDYGTFTSTTTNPTTFIVPSNTSNIIANTLANTYTLKYNANGGTGSAPDTPASGADDATITYGDTISLGENAYTRTGHDFVGWNIGTSGSNASSASYAETQSVPVAELVANANIVDNNGATLNLYAVWEAYWNYTLNYNANGGSDAPSSEASLDDLSSTHIFNVSSSIPTRTGYTFLGWSEDSSATVATYGPGDAITFNGNVGTPDVTKTLYAVWQINSYTQTTEIRYENADGTFTNYETVDTQTLDYGQTYSWSTPATAVYQAATVEAYTVTEDHTNQVTVYRNTYTQTTQVRYENADGTYGSYSTAETRTMRYGETYSWSQAAGSVGGVPYQAASVASYTVTQANTNSVNILRQTYTQTTQIRYENADGTYGSYTTADTQTLRYGQTYSWSKAAGTEGGVPYQAASVTAYTVTQDKTNSVNIMRVTYTQTTQVRYETTTGGWGSYSTVETKAVRYGASYSYSRAADTTYKAASVAAYTVTAAKTNSVSVYRNTFTITWNANGGTISKTSESYRYGQSLSLPTGSRYTYTLKGFYTASSGGTQVTASTTVTAAKTYYAQWNTTAWSSCSTTAGQPCTVSDKTYRRMQDGKLYTVDYSFVTWDNRNKCPSGTSVPTQAQFLNLLKAYGGSGQMSDGGAIPQSNITTFRTHSTWGTRSYWSATQVDSSNAYALDIGSNAVKVYSRAKTASSTSVLCVVN